MRPRTLFALGIGGYVAGACWTLALLAGVTAPALPPLALPVALAALGFVTGAFAADRSSLFDRIGDLQGNWPGAVAVFLLPVLLLAATLAETGFLGTDLGDLLPLAGSAVALVGALLVAHATERRRVDRVLAESDVCVRLPGRYTYVRREYGRLLLVGLVAYLALLAGLFTVSGMDSFLLISQAALLSVGWSLVRNHDFVVTTEGLVQGVSVTPWDRFESYELTDDYLVLHHSGWGRGRYRLPREAVDDEDAALDALARFLPRGNEA